MATIKRIVTSEVEGRNLSDFYGDNSYAFNVDGRINYYGTGKMGPLIEPGILYGSNADSGDGYGYNTIKLVPHAPNGSINDDRYLIIDPTTPNHIHIRAGGAQDASNAELILGGEKNFVKINDGSRNVTISSKQQQTIQAVLNINFESNDYLVFNDVVPVSSNGWYTEVNGTRYYVADVTYPTEGQTQAYVPGAPLQFNGVYNLFSPETSNQWLFDSEGIVYGPGSNGLTTFTSINVNGNYDEFNGQNIKIGDDAWIGDFNFGNHIGIKGLQNPSNGGIIFGSARTESISAEEGNLNITSDDNMRLESRYGNMNFYMDGGMYIGDSNSNNQIIKRSDLNLVEAKTLPTGGTTGQVLSKVDGTDYNATWTDVVASSTSVLKHAVKLGEAVTKGQAVYVSSADGTNMIVSKASNASEATSSKTLGLVETTGILNDQVNVITEGLLAGLDTSTATAGDPVWLGTGGNLIYGLANKPVAPNHLVFIGVVTRVQQNNGEIFVKVQNGFELNEIHNVLLEANGSIADNEVLAYDTASGLWKNQTAAEAGFASLASPTFTGTVTLPALTNIATETGTTNKTVNIGTGASGGTTNVNIGTLSASGSTTFNHPVNFTAVINPRQIENGNGNNANIALFASQTTGNINIAGGVAFNGSVNLASGTTTTNKTVNIGINGTAGSTVVNIGTASGGTSSINLQGRVIVPNGNAPASATATGTTGQIAWDADYVYVCTATNTWKRTALTTW